MTATQTTTDTDARRWAAIQARDRKADGSFVYAVRTTGIYCRPSCASRQALRANVSFHANAAAAERAGFRACKRCRPQETGNGDRHAELVARLCRLIERSEKAPTLAELAAAARLSRFHLHRVFVAATRIEPNEHSASAKRMVVAAPPARKRVGVMPSAAVDSA